MVLLHMSWQFDDAETFEAFWTLFIIWFLLFLFLWLNLWFNFLFFIYLQMLGHTMFNQQLYVSEYSWT